EQIAVTVLTDPALRKEWEDEVAQMRVRIKAMRTQLHDALVKQCPGVDFSYIVKQRGMFSYTGLSREQVERLRDEFAVYLVGSGRMCVAGLNAKNVAYTAQAFAAVMQH
ncbi:MAG: aminotransferase class I/II-fold pyridoxal phosphate-dependent enzyme, partial [Burkholderiales bacterium]|nr:aminotransferase class I/II-fold pyridoxal phosphate-dependent enzyme [Burkholderiales bacterium]